MPISKDGHVAAADVVEKRSHRSKSDKEKRDRDKTREKDRDGVREHGRKLSRTSKSTAKTDDSETGSRSHRKHRSSRNKEEGRTREKQMMESDMVDVVPELMRNRSHISIPYPSLNKNCSKDAIYSREDEAAPTARRTDPLTPEATDLGEDGMARAKSADSAAAGKKGSSSPQQDRPPSPPETDLTGPKKRSETASWPWARYRNETTSKSFRAPSTSEATLTKPSIWTDEPRARRAEGSWLARPWTTSKPLSAKAAKPRTTEPDDGAEPVPEPPRQTPARTARRPGQDDDDERRQTKLGYQVAAARFPAGGIVAQPPPPPPPLKVQEAPKVDYLLQNGGLPQPVSRSFLSVLPRQHGRRAAAATLFAPFIQLLDQYDAVLCGQGSMAVATGHRSVARRLLDRLEKVFSRDLPAAGCECIMCGRAGEARRGLGWGEVLERVSGRCDLPPWPPFDLASLTSRAAADTAGTAARPASPFNMDPDVAEEFREHYLRQSKQVRAAVDSWMTNCDKMPPPAVDDETLSFAMLTTLDRDDRAYFDAFLAGSHDARRARCDFLSKTSLAIQRLHRLAQPPRDAETAVYLVRNPRVHHLLNTIADMLPAEWEMLTSGRFDGFLWSGVGDADDVVRTPRRPSGLSSPQPSANSRAATPASMSASTASLAHSAASTATNRMAVLHDEETEIAALAEVELDIFAGMEALENAFETLHERAELVRTALRQRGAGLAVRLRQRRSSSMFGGLDVTSLSGGSRVNDMSWIPCSLRHDDDVAALPQDLLEIGSEAGWAWTGGGSGFGGGGGDDAMSEIRPDESASNVSSARHRRPKRRKERATPAPIEEEGGH